MAQIEKRGDRYKITVYLGKDMDGHRKYERTTYIPEATTPAEIAKEVRLFAAEFEKLAKNGGILGGDKITFYEFATTVWIQWMDVQRERRITRMSYEDILKNHVFPVIGTMKLSSITSLHIQAIVDKMHADGLANSTIKHAVHAASSVFSCALKKHVIDDNPCEAKRIDYPEHQKKAARLQYFTIDQARRFLNALGEPMIIQHPEVIRKNGKVMPAWTETRTFNPQFQVYFYLAIFGGFRRGELVALKWTDIDFKNLTITIQKTARRIRSDTIIKEPKTASSNRTIALPKFCFDKLRSLKESREILSSWVFVQPDGVTMMGVETPSHFFRSFLDAYNETHPEEQLPRIRMHDLRHTTITLLLAYGADPKTVQKRAGHQDFETTMNVYAHDVEELDRNAANLLEKLFIGG